MMRPSILNNSLSAMSALQTFIQNFALLSQEPTWPRSPTVYNFFYIYKSFIVNMNIIYLILIYLLSNWYKNSIIFYFNHNKTKYKCHVQVGFLFHIYYIYLPVCIWYILYLIVFLLCILCFILFTIFYGFYILLMYICPGHFFFYFVIPVISNIFI